MYVTSLPRHRFQLKSKFKSEIQIYVNPKNKACKLLEIVLKNNYIHLVIDKLNYIIKILKTIKCESEEK